MSPRELKLRAKLAWLDNLELQLSQAIPGTPATLRSSDAKAERLPGMRRWVNRDAVERAMVAYDAGVAPEEFMASEGSRSGLGKALGSAAFGGAAAGLLAHKNQDNSFVQAMSQRTGGHGPLAAALLGALASGGATAVSHAMGAGKRRDDALEAYQGARLDAFRNPRPKLTALPQDRQDEASAASVAPRLLHVAPSSA